MRQICIGKSFHANPNRKQTQIVHNDKSILIRKHKL